MKVHVHQIQNHSSNIMLTAFGSDFKDNPLKKKKKKCWNTKANSLSLFFKYINTLKIFGFELKIKMRRDNRSKFQLSFPDIYIHLDVNDK